MNGNDFMINRLFHKFDKQKYLQFFFLAHMHAIHTKKNTVKKKHKFFSTFYLELLNIYLETKNDLYLIAANNCN